LHPVTSASDAFGYAVAAAKYGVVKKGAVSSFLPHPSNHPALLLIALFDCLAFTLWKATIQSGNALRRRYPTLDDEVQKLEEPYCRCLVILQINLTRVYCVITDHPKDIHRLLYLDLQTFADKGGNVIVNILALLAQEGHELLNTKPNKRSCASW
jgi:hypothetical protein